MEWNKCGKQERMKPLLTKILKSRPWDNAISEFWLALPSWFMPCSTNMEKKVWKGVEPKISVMHCAVQTVLSNKFEGWSFSQFLTIRQWKSCQSEWNYEKKRANGKTNISVVYANWLTSCKNRMPRAWLQPKPHFFPWILAFPFVAT